LGVKFLQHITAPSDLLSCHLAERHRVFMHILFSLIAVDGARYYYTNESIPGLPYTLPLVSTIAMMRCDGES
jgi:hypothetical protein